jgi:hypothetical protein
MLPDEINLVVEKLIELKKNNLTFQKEWDELYTKAENLIFKASCLKPYLSRCEPEYCTFRYTGECQFIDRLGKLKTIA